MIICFKVITRHNLKLPIKYINRMNGKIRQSNRFYSRTMSGKISQNKKYTSVEIISDKISETNNKKIWWKFWQKSPKKPEENGLKHNELMRLLNLAKPEKWRLTGAITFLLVSSLVTMAIPYSLGKILDIIYTENVDPDQARTKLNTVGGVLVGVFILGAICNFARVYLMSVSGYNMTQTLRQKLFTAIMQQEQGWFDSRSTGELINRLSADTQLVGQALSTNISDGLRSTAMVFVSTGLMFYMSPELALVGLAIVPPVTGCAIVYGRFVRNISKKVQDTLADATRVAEERIANVRTVKTFSQESREMADYSKSIGNILKQSYIEARAKAGFYAFTGFCGHLIIISVLYYGGIMVSSHTITVGNLSSFLLYAAYIGISVGSLSSSYTEFNKSIGASVRIWEILDRQPLVPTKGGNIPLSPLKGHIEFNGIHFVYPGRDDISVLKDFNLIIEPGTTVAVVGASGSGKSTLGALLLRLYDPTDGAVYVDGNNIKDVDPNWLRKNIGTVGQEPVLFSTSIRDNILYGLESSETISDYEFVRVTHEANVFEFVQNLPDGFETLVGERGVMLSGGQKQRVALARALIKNPKILLLDEATSALDAQSEHLVQEALDRVMKGRTVLTIAHRLSTIQNADVIAVLRDGKIVEKGTYDELINIKKGAFKELMKHQRYHGNV